MSVQLGINGFGRIGRFVFRSTFGPNSTKGKVMAINASYPNEYLAYLLKYDSCHGIFNHKVEHNDEGLIIDGTLVRTFHERDPSKLPWGNVGADFVADCTGAFLTTEKAEAHL